MDIPDGKKYELGKQARKNKVVAFLLALLITPIAYVYVNEGGWALVNFLTLNYFLFGFIVVPIHTIFQIQSARDELDRAGVEWR